MFNVIVQLARLVPKDLPLTMWYVVLSSLLWLHFQADKMAIQAMDDIKLVAHTHTHTRTVL